ncbi:hypothetical protein [Cellulosimicrobium sp. SH8]|uniref:hypothetical protein n=1 Tax=Cellulosimicrobium sp. SH8 TaxID=2952936 RepID=UPI0021F3B75B|nr:hypothetical protein [Cellulosimicrobium sp. SH8]
MFFTRPARRIAAALATLWLATGAFLTVTATSATAVALDTGTATAPPAFAFTLDPATVVQILVAIVLPVLVGLVTTRVTSGAAKAWLLAALSLVTSLLVELGRAVAQGVTYDFGVALLAAIPAFVVSVATHYGLWKPTGVTDKVQAVGRHRAG